MTFYPKKNKTLEMLKKGEAVLGTQVYTRSPSIIEIAALAGLDYYMLDMEHSRVNVETMEHCIRAADAADITSFVRVAQKNNHSLISQAVESGAQGIIVPFINNKHDAKQAANALRYPPEGTLGACPAIRSASYSSSGWEDYVKHNNDETMLIVMIEHIDALNNLEEIFSELKPGVDAVLFGRADFAASLVNPGEEVNWHHPTVTKAFDKIVSLAKEAGIYVMTVPFPETTVEVAKENILKGTQMCLFGIDQLILYEAYQDIAQKFKNKF